MREPLESKRQCTFIKVHGAKKNESCLETNRVFATPLKSKRRWNLAFTRETFTLRLLYRNRVNPRLFKSASRAARPG